MAERERLNIAINTISDRFNISDRKDIALKLGIEQTYFSAMLGGSKRISRKLLEKLQEVFGINIVWLKTGEGEMFVQPPTANNTINNSGDFCENVIGGDLKQQLAELINIQKKFQDMISVKDKQINELIEILKDKKK